MIQKTMIRCIEAYKQMNSLRTKNDI